MSPIQVFVECGKKRVFAGAVDWPGWIRSGRDEEAALRALVDYGPRYARVLQVETMAYQAPAHISEFIVTERHPGNATTDFGAPAVVLEVDRAPLEGEEFERWFAIVQACWRAFDRAVEGAAGRALRKGPRGGGRDLEKIVEHVLDADRGYLSRLAWRYKGDPEAPPAEESQGIREAIQAALDVARQGNMPEKGPRGGTLWPPRYFMRRVAWHVLDHVWEIEDRVVSHGGG